MTFERLILGDNQFIGVNHADQGKAASLYQQFSEVDAIIEVLGWAYNAGVRDFMFTTHDRYSLVFEEIIRSNLFPNLHFTPSLPYAHKYANALAEHGMIHVILSNLRDVSKIRLIPAMGQALIGDFSGLMKLLIEIELLLCKGLPIRGVFLLNIMFDLLIAFNSYKLIEKYYRFVSDELKVIPGFFTMNHPIAVEVLCDKIGLQKPWLCSNLNIDGFRTNPSKTAVLESFASEKTYNIAMSVFASGAIKDNNALKFVINAKGVNAIIFGSSKQKNIEENAAIILDS